MQKQIYTTFIFLGVCKVSIYMCVCIYIYISYSIIFDQNLVVTLSKAHLTLHSRMSGSRWVITPLGLSGAWRSFLYSSSVYSCHLFLILSASVRSIPFLSFIVSIFAWNVPLVSLIFLKRSLVFPILLFYSIFCIDRWRRLSYLFLLLFGTLHSDVCIFPFLLCFSLLFFSPLFVRLPPDNHYAFWHFFSMGMVLIYRKL